MVLPHCTGKVRYKTFIQAKHFIGLIEGREKKHNKKRCGEKRRIYRCPSCGLYHIGRTDR